MAKDIKTKEKVIEKKSKGSVGKAADRAKIISVKAKGGVIEAKDEVQKKTNMTDDCSPEQYATDEVSESMHTVAEDAGIVADKAVRTGTRKIKEKAKQKEVTTPDKKNKTGSNSDEAQSDEKIQPNEQSKPHTENDKINQKPDVSQKQKKPVDEKKKPKQRKQTPPKTRGELAVKKPKADQQPVKYTNSGETKIKQTARSSANAKNTIKTADSTAKNVHKAEKTAQKSVETAKQRKPKKLQKRPQRPLLKLQKQSTKP